jgi:phosphohistidine phosphatase
MKTIILVRHAKASRDIPGIEDFDRPLTAEGYAEAYSMAAEFKKKKVKTGLIISSPAIRAISTAYIFARELNQPLNSILIREELFTDSYKDIIETLKNLPGKTSSVMLFGHNPSFENLANYLSETPLEKIHTCGVLCLEKTKAKLKEHSMKIIFYLHPKLSNK